MTEYNIKEFKDILASAEPVPGGGGASAYVASLGMALGTMVANLTTGKKKYAQYQEEIEQAIAQSEKISDELIEFIKKDAEAFEPLSKAYGLPKDTDEQRKERDKVLENALVVASEAPIELMKNIMEAIKLLDRLSIIGSRLAISDVGVGIQFAKAALNGASLNVFINTKLMKDRDKAQVMNEETESILKAGNELADKIYNEVLNAIIVK